jgi:hypothetical protein
VSVFGFNLIFSTGPVTLPALQFAGQLVVSTQPVTIQNAIVTSNSASVFSQGMWRSPLNANCLETPRFCVFPRLLCVL